MSGSVLVLDDDDDLRETLGELIELLGHRCVPAASFEDTVAQRDAVLACKLAILDVNLGPAAPSGLDVYRWLKCESFEGTIVFLTGHARSHPLVASACRVGACVLEKPITSKSLRGLLERSAE